MEHLLQLLSTKKGIRISKITGTFMLLFIGNIFMINAQNIYWSTGYPKMNTADLILEESVGSLLISITPMGGNVANAAVEVVLPPNIEYQSASATTSGITLGSIITSGLYATGQTITIPIASYSNSLLSGVPVEFEVKVKAKCGAESGKQITVNIKSDGNIVTDGTKAAAGANIKMAALTLIAPTPSYNVSGANVAQTVTYTLKTAEYKASSAKIVFTADNTVTLSGFKVGTIDVSAAETVNGYGDKEYTLDLKMAQLADSIDNITGKTITYSAESNSGCGNHIITSEVTYLPETSCSPAVPGTSVSLLLPGGNGILEIVHVNTTYVNSSDAPIDKIQINMDGTTPTDIRIQYKNTGTLSSKRTVLDFYGNGRYAYTDTANMWIQVGSGVKKKIPASQINIIGRLSNHVDYGYYGSNAGKPTSFNIDITDEIPAGATFTVWIPMYNGSVYDNGTNPVYINGACHINGITTNITKAETPCGDAGITYVSSAQLAASNTPHFRQEPPALVLKEGEVKTQTIYVSPGTIASTTLQSVFVVDVPDWMTISSGGIKLTSDISGMGTTYTGTFSTESAAAGRNRYSMKYVNGVPTGEAYLHVTYNVSSTACGGGNTDKTGQIHYWTNQIWPSNTLEYISQVFQDIKLKCKVDGLVLEDFSFVRKTKGLKDTDNNHIPDNTSAAPDAEILHNIYVQGDKGEISWRIKVKEGGYKYLYLPMETSLFTIGAATQQLRLNSSSINVSGGSVETTDFLDISNNYRKAIRLENSGGFTAETAYTITIPFEMNAGVNNYILINTTPFLSNTSAPDPFTMSSANKKGDEMGSYQFGSFSINRVAYLNGTTWNFPDNTWQTISGAYANIFHGDQFPGLSKEARNHEYLDSVVFEVPEGYRMESLTLTPSTADGHALAAGTNKIVTPDASSTATHYKFVIGSNVYDLNYGPGPYSAGKWMLPDDRWQLFLNPKIRATNSTAQGTGKIVLNAYYKDKETGLPALIIREGSCAYSGYSLFTDITPSGATVTAYASEASGPTLLLTNPNAGEIKDTWVYMAGNVKDVKLKLIGGADTEYTGTGADKRWVHIPTLAPGTTTSFTLLYTYTGASCSENPMTLHIASGLKGTWAPSPTEQNSAMDINSIYYVSSETFKVKWGDATATGSIEAPVTDIPHESVGTYKIGVVFSSTNSTGALKNPEMILTVPANQKYKSGTAKIEYPIGSTPVSVDASFNTALSTALGSYSSSSKTVTINLKDTKGIDMILPGILDELTTDNKYRNAKVWLEFEANCDTKWAGLQYTGVVSGISACGVTAATPYPNVFGPMLRPDVSQNYLFSVEMNILSGNKAYNEIRTQDSLEVTIKKVLGHTVADKLSATDYLELRMPEEFNLDGTFVYEGTGALNAVQPGTEGSVTDDDVSAGVRTLKLSLPVAEYNAAANMGFNNGTVVYRIPVIYTPNGQNRTVNPIDSFVCSVMGDAQFGNCAPIKWPAGDITCDNIAMVTSADPLPIIVYRDSTAKLESTSNGFEGNWYTAENGGSQVASATNPYLWTVPSTCELGDTLFHAEAKFDGYTYGRVPYKLLVYMHPQINKDLDTFKYACEDSDSLFIEAEGIDITYQWYHELTTPIAGATDPYYIATVAGRYHVLVIDSVNETISSDTMDLYFNFIPEFTLNLPKKLHECEQIIKTLEVQTTGKYLSYQWYRNGVEIKGANTNRYTAHMADSSAFFRVLVTTPCLDSVMSESCYMSFCDEWANAYITRLITIDGPTTAKTDPPYGSTFNKSHTDFEFTIKMQEGYSGKYLDITTDNAIWSKDGGMEITHISEDSIKVTLSTVFQPLKITLSGISPVSNSLIGLDKNNRAWSYESRLYIRSGNAGMVRIYNMMGIQCRQVEFREAGEKSILMPSGIYVIIFDDGHSEKVLIK